MAEQRLRHGFITIDTNIYFYDGELPVVGGVVTIPDGNETWAGAAWIRGYRIDADTGEALNHNEVMERARAREEAAESGSETSANESADTRGQSPDRDGLREGEPARGDVLPEDGDGSGLGDGPADGEQVSED